MAVKMGVSKEQLEGYKPLPNGVYSIQLAGFEPKFSQKKDSVNLNPILKVVNDPENNGKRIFFNCNTKAAFMWHDFSHCFGLPVEFEGDEPWLPGGSKAWGAKPGTSDENPENWVYRGPLTGKVGKVEVVVTKRPGQKDRNEIKMFICKIEDCATKYPDVSHSTNLIK